MKTSSLWKRWTALALSLVLVLGMLPLTAGAAFSPANYLRNVGYYGNKNKCVMSYDMAQAYADVLEKLPNNRKAILVDPAGDGMPLLVTTTAATLNIFELWYQGAGFQFWTWDGAKARAYDIDADTEKYFNEFSFGMYEGQPVLAVFDGSEGQSADNHGVLYYSVKNAEIKLLSQSMSYSAYSNDGVIATGEKLHLVQASKYNNDGSYYESAPVSALLKAGWIQAGSFYLLLEKVDGKFLSFKTFEEWCSWHEAQFLKYKANSSQIYFLDPSEVDGEIDLLGDWKSASSMASALRTYAQAAAAAQGSFLDVPTSNYAYDPVVWAVQEGITNGTSATTFSPDKTCTQGQILTFLWRAVGEPKAAIANPFTNSAVTSGQYYYNAMLWAYEQGIVTSKSLNPNAGCQRSDVALYLWRLAGSPAAGGATFSDVSPSAPYAQAVAWAVKEGITNGTSATTFSPSATCTRGQIVTFLYRDMA